MCKSGDDPTIEQRGPVRHPTYPGIVAAVYADRCLVRDERGERVCTLRGRFLGGAMPVVGDRVDFTAHPDGTGTVTVLHARRNTLVRGSADRKRGRRNPVPQVLAANVDQLVVVAALAEPPYRPGLVDRFLVAAAQAGIAPLICITKLDLDPGGLFDSIRAVYLRLGIAVIGTDTARPETLAPLAAALAGRTNVLVGHSGVGKTTLLNALAGTRRPVREVDPTRKRGRHTTTTAHLIPLREGGYAVDSPGIREFGLHGIGPAELAALFPDFAPYWGQCGFRDCLHRGEPGCAMAAAVARGELPAERYESYGRLLRELAEEGG